MEENEWEKRMKEKEEKEKEGTKGRKMNKKE